MKKKLILTIVLGIFTIIIVCLLSLSAQDKKVIDNKVNQTTKLSKSIKLDGWSIPDVRDSEVIDSDIYKMQNASVARKLYRLKDRIYAELDFYSLDDDKNVIVKKKELAITTLLAYSFNGKTFEYVIQYIPYAVSNTGSKALGGFPVTICYVDGNGDGKFEIRYEEPDFPNEVPDWVTKVQN
jgi:hypothetical protein